MTEQEKKDLSEMSSQEVEDEILLKQQELNQQIDNLALVLNAITENKTNFGVLKSKEFQAEEVIRRTKQEIKNLESVWKWRAIRKER